MRVTRIAMVGFGAAAVMLATGTGAWAVAAQPGNPALGHHTSADLRQRLDGHLVALTARATALRARVDASPKLTAAEKAELDADLTKLLADAATAFHQVGSATDKTGLRAADTAVQAVHADRLKLATDWQTIRHAYPGHA